MKKTVYKNNLFGYTLIEVMVALMVFAIIATISSSVMYHVFDIRERVAVQADHLDELQLVMTLLDHDTVQFLPRSVRTDDLKIYPSFIGNYQYMEFTRGGLVNPDAVDKRSELKRIAYLCQSNRLVRRSWAVLDIINRGQYEDKVLLTNLKTCSLAYINNYQQILKDWHASVGEADLKMQTPSGVQLTINPYGWGDLVFVFVIPEGLYAYE